MHTDVYIKKKTLNKEITKKKIKMQKSYQNTNISKEI